MKQDTLFCSANPAVDLGEILWLQYISALEDKIQIQGTPQVTYPFSVWDWGGKSTLPGLTFPQYQFLDQVPEAPVPNSQEFGSKPGFGSQYRLFLQSIDDIPATDNAAYEKLLQDQDDAINQLNLVISEIVAAFQNYLDAGGTETRTEWLNHEGVGFKLKLEQANDAYATATARVDNFRQKLAGPIKDALEIYQDNLINIPDPLNPQKPLKVPGWGTSQTPYNHVLQITGNQFGGNATKGAQASFGITAATKRFDFEKAYGSGQTYVFGDFFAAELNGSYERVDTSSFTSEYSITYQYQDLTTVKVSPGAWFTGGIMGTYQNGPYFPFRPSGFKQDGTRPYFFGSGGLLARQITDVVVGYRPQVIIDGGEQFRQTVEQQIKVGGGLRIGPFFVGGDGGSETTSGSISFDGAQITVQGEGDWPYIMAVVSAYTVDPQ